jgi:hypothetical protein
MKQIIFIIPVLVFITYSTMANDDKYLEAMAKNIKSIYEARDIAAYQQAVNSFERIASVESNKWEPLYYIAFGNIMIANLESDNQKKDQYLDRATEVIGRAKEINGGESEIIALEGFVFMMKISVDPQSRGPVYAPQAMTSFNKALSLNPENPRAMALLAQMQYGTAQFFNSSTAEACQLNLKASEKFASYKPENQLAPAWGKNMIESLKEKCR